MLDDQLPRLEGLFALSRVPGLNVRPTLLRVLTDLFVDAGHRADIDIARYTELAGHLIEQVDEDTRVAVARKLGRCAFAPRPVIDRLIASEPSVSAEVIGASPLLSRDDLWALATDGGPVTDAAIARRPDLDGELTRFLARKAHPLVADALVANPDAPIDRESVFLLAAVAPEVPGLALRLATRRGVRPQWLAPLFLDLEAESRAPVIEAFRSAANAASFSTREAQVFAPKLILDALEQAALGRAEDEFAGGLQALLGVSAEVARRIAGDVDGEALALALAAIGMPSDQAARAMMFVNQTASQDVMRLRALTQLMETMPRAAATRLVRGFAAQSAPRGSRHEPVFSASQPARGRGKGQQADRPADAAKTRNKGADKAG